MNRRIFTALGLFGALAFVACSESGTEPFAPLGAQAPAVQETSEARGAAPAPAPGDEAIATIAINAGFSELVGALVYVDEELDAGLVDLFLNGTDQYTVFAPTNEAFQRLYGLLSAVLGAEIDEIRDVPAQVVLDVLFYHVAEGRRAAASVLPPTGEREITTLLGETFDVRTDGTIEDGLTGLREDAAIVAADISASNGIIHVIDQVIVPPSVVAALTN